MSLTRFQMPLVDIITMTIYNKLRKGVVVIMLGDNIQKLRKSKGLSQEQLGIQIDVTRQTISNWELNVTSPNPQQLVLLSNYFGISIDDLLDNDVKNVLVEKVSNTERLAGIIIKILKGIGILLIAIVVMAILNLILFTSTTKVVTTTQGISIEEYVGDNLYTINISDDGTFDCYNMSETMEEEIFELVDFSNLKTTEINIEKYFETLRDNESNS